MRFIALIVISAFLPFGLTLLALDATHPSVSADAPDGPLVLGVFESARDGGGAAAVSPEAEALPESDEKAGRPYPVPGFRDFPPLSARAAVLDAASGQALYENGADEARPIASLTKLAAALVFLGSAPDLDAAYTVRASDLVPGARHYLKAGDKVRQGDLLALALAASANEAAQALAGAAGMDTASFVQEMNRSAAELGLVDTRFADPTGISPGNVSTAREVGRLIEAALDHEAVSAALARPAVEFRTLDGRPVSAKSTDGLLADYPRDGVRLLGGKTGYTRSAGYCFAAVFERDGRSLVVSVLGEEAPRARFATAERLMRWAYDNFAWE